MKSKNKRLNRKIHFWLSLAILIPSLIVIGTGVLLLLKKEFQWIQPETIKTNPSSFGSPQISYEEILIQSKKIKQTEIKSWDDIDRMDYKPAKGLIKIQAKNSWEIQMDSSNGEILQVAYRRSDLIESIHDGSFFHDFAKLGIMLPSAIILLILWITGLIMLVIKLSNK